MDNNKRLPKMIQVLYGIGVSYAIVDQIFAQWVLYYYLPPEASDLQPLLPPLFISIALVISRFVDVIFDPLVGYLSDKFNSRWGRRIPFIAVGTVPLALATAAFFYPPTGDTWSTFFYLMVVGCLFFIFYTLVGGPYNALIPEIAQSKDDRLNLSTWQSVFRLLYTGIAMILPGVLIAALGQGNEELGIRRMVMLLSLLVVIGLFITVFLIDERKYSGGKTSQLDFKVSLKLAFSNRSFVFYLLGFMFFFLGFNILRASINYYVEELMGLGKPAITLATGVLFGTAALFFYPVNRLSKKVGYKRLMQASLILLILFSFSLFQLGKVIPSRFGFLIFGLMGIPISGAAFIFPPAMLSEISAVVAEREDVQIEGVFFGIQGFFLKLAFLLSISILPLILVSGGEVPLLESIIGDLQQVQQIGVYNTTLFAAASFAIALLFYSFYQEETAK